MDGPRVGWSIEQSSFKLLILLVISLCAVEIALLSITKDTVLSAQFLRAANVTLSARTSSRWTFTTRVSIECLVHLARPEHCSLSPRTFSSLCKSMYLALTITPLMLSDVNNAYNPSSSSSSSIATNCWNPSQNKPLGPNRWQVEAKKLISLWFVIWKFLCNLSARNLNITQWWRQRGSCCWCNFYSDEFTWWRGGEKGLELYVPRTWVQARKTRSMTEQRLSVFTDGLTYT